MRVFGGDHWTVFLENEWCDRSWKPVYLFGLYFSAGDTGDGLYVGLHLLGFNIEVARWKPLPLRERVS